MIRFLLAAILLAAGIARGEEFTAKVIAVLDGDTVLVLRGDHPSKVRLAEIDAPEVGHAGTGGQTPTAQIFGETSKRSLSDMVLGKQVNFTTQAVDQYGRLVAHLSVDGLEVNAEQIRRGMAWEYSRYHSNKYLIKLENEARQAPRGLWALSNPIPPWDWRRQHPGTYPGPVPGKAMSPDTDCASRKHCSEMISCEEARHFLALCGGKTLDGDGDGVPCESLCGGGR